MTTRESSWEAFKRGLKEEVEAARLKRLAERENFQLRLRAFRRQNPGLDQVPIEPERIE
jgi:hypothetical protein